MKHLFLFLFDMGDSIKASGSKCCNTRLSVETSKNVTLCRSGRKKIAYIFLSLSLSFFLQKYWTNKTCIPGPEMLQRAHVCWDWLWNVEQRWLLSLHFSQRTLIRALQKSGQICKARRGEFEPQRLPLQRLHRVETCHWNISNDHSVITYSQVMRFHAVCMGCMLILAGHDATVIAGLRWTTAAATDKKKR